LETASSFALQQRPRLRHVIRQAQEAVAGRQDLDGSVFPHAVLGQPRWGRQGRKVAFLGQNSVPKLWQVTAVFDEVDLKLPVCLKFGYLGSVQQMIDSDGPKHDLNSK